MAKSTHTNFPYFPYFEYGVCLTECRPKQNNLLQNLRFFKISDNVTLYCAKSFSFGLRRSSKLQNFNVSKIGFCFRSGPGLRLDETGCPTDRFSVLFLRFYLMAKAESSFRNAVML
jgi:hypothetical protein